MPISLFTNGPLPPGKWQPLATNPLPYAGLLSSLPEEYDYFAEVQGRLPTELVGTLYRNGPGLFDRANGRKRMVLDGDGMIQVIDIKNGKVRFRNRFVRTQKFIEESRLDRFKYATWSTQAPGGPFVNIMGWNIANQAGVTVIRQGQEIFALDEGSLPYRMDAETLETLGTRDLGGIGGFDKFQAHYKVNGRTGDWHHFGMEYGKKPRVHITTLDSAGTLKQQFAIDLPRSAYMHDWAVTENYAIFLLHPAEVRAWDGLLFMMGFRAVTDVISWNPSKGNLVLVVDRRDPGRTWIFDAPSAWMWHSLNAYEEKNEIFVDFVGSNPTAGSLNNENSPFFKVMEGIVPQVTKNTGVARALLLRYVINLDTKKLRQEVLADEDEYEMPTISSRVGCLKHRYGYVARRGCADFLWSSVAQVDTKTGKVSAFDFGPGQYCLEPIFAPGDLNSSAGESSGYLLSEVYDSKTKKSYIAVFLADRIECGPVAQVMLRHHVPMNFHGSWYSHE